MRKDIEIEEENMPSEAYKRVKRKQALRRKKERIRNMLIIAGIIILLLIILLIKGAVACVSSCNKQEKKTQVTTTTEATTEEEEQQEPTTETVVEEKPMFKEVTAPAVSTNFKKAGSELLSPHIVLIDVNTNEIIAGRNYNAKIYPASMTKVMTLIVAVENLKDMEDKYKFDNETIGVLYEQEASMAGFAPGESVTVEDMLYGLILPSGADAAAGLANKIAGSEEKFVKLMNDKCKEMGLKNTHFTNPVGLHNEDNYSTPVEIAMIVEYAMSNETCAKILKTYQYTTRKTKEHPEGLTLTSTMYSRMYGNEVDTVEIIGGKTGYTAEALQCLVSYAIRDKDAYVAVTAKATGKWHCIFDTFGLYGNYIKNPPGYVRQ